MSKLILVLLLSLCVAGCAKTTALLSGGRIVDIACPRINPLTGNIAVMPNGKAAINKYKYITGGASQEFEVRADGCASAKTKGSIQGESRIDQTVGAAGAVIDRGERVVPGG